MSLDAPDRLPAAPIDETLALITAVRNEHRVRNGLAPVAETPPSEGFHLRRLQRGWGLVAEPALPNNRTPIGRALAAGRRVAWVLARPWLMPQADFNHAVSELVGRLLADRDRLTAENAALKERLDALEAAMAGRAPHADRDR